jgi:hypothetical protein
MKPSAALVVTLLALGTAVDLLAQGHAVGIPMEGGNSSTGLGTTSKNAAGAQSSDHTPTDVEGDDTVVRLKTQDSMASGAMSRDEGQLTMRQHRKEKISEVDSAEKLKTSGIDPKFQGSLLHSSVTSIDDVSTNPGQEGERQSVGQPLRHKIFVTEDSGESKKKSETAQAKPDSSPSPSPSPSVAADATRR